jgi:hypothetical protein
LPYSLLHPTSGLSIFAVFYGLDWIATVPPTVRLTANTFGKENVGVVYGWIGAAHQLGASLAAITAGSIVFGRLSRRFLALWRILLARRNDANFHAH